VPVDESAQPSQGTPVAEPTGDPAVDTVLSKLSDVAEAPVAQHARLYAELHDGLLAVLNEEPGQATASAPAPGSGSVSVSGPGGVPAAGPRPGPGAA